MDVPEQANDGEIVLREERLLVEKQRESIGEAVVRTDVASTPVRHRVPLLWETLHIRTRPVERPDDSEAGPIDGPQQLVVQLSREAVETHKRTETAEEVSLVRRSVRSVVTVSDTVARERLIVDNGRP